MEERPYQLEPPEIEKCGQILIQAGIIKAVAAAENVAEDPPPYEWPPDETQDGDSEPSDSSPRARELNIPVEGPEPGYPVDDGVCALPSEDADPPSEPVFVFSRK